MSDDQPPPPPPPPPDLTAPPGYVPYGTAPGPLTRVSRVGGVSKAAVVLVAIAGIAGAIGGLLAPAAEDAALDFLDGRVSEDDFLESYGPLALSQIVGTIVSLAAAIVSIVWMYRIASNVRAYGRRTFWHPLFAIFGWLLPPLIFVIPFLMLRELWKASSPEHVDGTDTWKQQPENPTLWAWWILYGIVPLGLAAIELNSLFGGGFSGGTDAESLAESIEGVGTINLVGGLVGLAAAIAWILVIRQVTRRHMALTNES